MRFAVLLILSLSTLFGCSRTGSFAQPTAAAPQPSVVTFGTGTDCQPKIVLFFYNHRTADGGAANAMFGFGAAATTSQRMAGFSRSTDASGSSDADRAVSTSLAIVVISTAQAIIASADLVSLNTDGFELTWTVTDATARIINYVAIGGSDVTNIAIGTFTGSGSPQEINFGVAFQADLLILYGPGNATGNNFTTTIGMVTASDSWSVSSSAENGDTNMVTKRLQRTGISFNPLAGGGTVLSECTTVLDADGFTQTCPTQGAAVTQYVAIKGGSYKLGSFTQPVTPNTGNQTISGVGFTPKTLLLAAYGTTAQSTLQANSRASWGAGTSSANRWSIWYGDTDAAATSVTSSYLDRTKIFHTKTEAGATPTAQTAADLVSFGSGEFVLNHTTVDATARQILYLAISTAEASAATSIPRRVFIQ